MSEGMFKGILTALITPFKDGKIDEKVYGDFIEWQVSEGVHGLVPCGTTGESPTLSYEEHHRVIEICVEVVNKRVPVLAGTGANATEEAVSFTKHAQKVGADGALVVAPYYNKPTDAGLYEHFKQIHDATSLPIVLYNVPGRTVINLSDTLIARLAKLANIIGVKDATGDLARPYTLRQLLTDEFCMISGEDMTAVAFNAAGGTGCISVTANVAPKLCAQVQEATLAGDYKQAFALQEKLVPLHEAMFCESSPGPVKFAASLMGKSADELRLPLVTPSIDNQKRIREVLVNLGLH